VLRSARTGTTATTPMPALLMVITARRGLAADSLSALARGTGAVITAIVADMDTDTVADTTATEAALDTVGDTGTGAVTVVVTAADTVVVTAAAITVVVMAAVIMERPLAVDSTVGEAAAFAAVAVVEADSTVAAVDTVVADTGNGWSVDS
jgi:hypothetical protein